MKKQIFSLILLTAFLASLMLVSAASVTTSPTSITFSSNGTSAVTGTSSFTLTNATVNQFNITNYTSILSFTYANKEANVTITGPSLNTNLSSAAFTLSASIPTKFLGSETKYVNVTFLNSTAQNESIQVPVTVGVSNPGELTVDKMEINVNEGFGKDDEYLYPLDQVSAKVRISNDGSWDMQNIEITACLLDTSTGNCVLDEGDMDLSDDSVDLDSDKHADITLTFEVDPDVLDVGDNDYTLYVSALGKINDNDADSYDDANSGSFDSEDIEIITDDTFAVISNVIYSETLNCGETLDISADVFNVGDADLDDDEVYFEVYNKELGIDQEITFDNGIDSMSKESVSFSTKLPSDVSSAKAYNIQLSVLDDHHKVMQNKEDDESKVLITVNVGKCIVPDTSSNVSITAELSEDTPTAVIGEQFVVESTITNTGSSSATYIVSVSGNEAWSKVSSIDPSTFTLSPEESKEVSIYFDVNSDAKAGDKDFTIKTVYGSKTSEQKVAVTLEEGLSSSKILKNIKDNSFVYTIVLVNLILLIAIIIVIVKMFGRKSSD